MEKRLHANRSPHLGRLLNSCRVAREARLFAVDFATYRVGPESDHAPYMVLVQAMPQEDMNELRRRRVIPPDVELPPASTQPRVWRDLQTLARVASTAKKQMLRARVLLVQDPVVPEGIETDPVEHFACHVRVELSKIRRFRCEQEGEKKRLAKEKQRTVRTPLPAGALLALHRGDEGIGWWPSLREWMEPQNEGSKG